MELIFLIAAFIAGFIALRCHLPPLVGFLIAGFSLKFAGYESTPLLNTLADLGVTLLLFSIGLKLDVKSLLNKDIWGGATLHNIISTLFFAGSIWLLKLLGINMLQDLALEQLLLLGFALSFSSTVFAIKVLQEKGELNATYGDLAIGILVMQDLFAVLFLTISTGKIPELTAFALFALPLARPLFHRLLDQSGHGEMLVLLGVCFALVFGAGLFDYVGMKADLGALIMGMLLAGHRKSSELSKALFNMKELFLVCFFLNIGLAESPSIEAFIFALLLLLLLPIKGLLYFSIFRACKYRLRTATLGSLTLFNFSEFGLIVGGLAYKMGWLPGELLAAIALAVSFSFILAAPLNNAGDILYNLGRHRIKEHQADTLNPADQLIDLGEAKVLILGMGRIGTGAYDELKEQFNNQILGIDNREDTVDHHQRHHRNVINGDANDPDFWERVITKKQVELILLAMPHSHANAHALEHIKSRNYQGRIAAIAQYNEDVEELLALGVDAAFNVYREAGSGFARHVCQQLTQRQ
ncbi:cation:proton antiporter family protein [Thaumasiovibrio subtropicus]|uniref:cation:proton antiporter family protein n=1 Tax=Thaumasiovibrio subtropicus TaxID=1891207 RepID=UPI000B35CC9A|nr:cation:proton antiporter family protein [Thaumasiovibrio subtropicus]